MTADPRDGDQRAGGKTAPPATLHDGDIRIAAGDGLLLDQPCALVARGAAAGDLVDVVVTCDYAVEGVWRAQATFVADDAGEVDVGRDAPVSGAWAGDPSGHGPWWSATRVSTTSSTDHTTLVPTVVGVRSVSAHTERTVHLSRLRCAAGIDPEPLVGDGYRATLWRAPAGSTVANVIWFGGAGGGHPRVPGALLASRGVTTMAVAYFGAPGLPSTLGDIPIEVAVRASRDVVQRSELKAAPIVVGVSRGSELAFLAAAHFPAEFAAVVGLVPSGRVHAIPGSTLDNLLHPWTLGGQPVDLLSSIPTDLIPGPILLLSAGDDRIMPTQQLAGEALQARGANGHRLDEHVCYPEAGHTFFGHPGVPVAEPADSRHPATGRSIVVGGTRRANGVACQQAWDKLLEFTRRVAAEERMLSWSRATRAMRSGGMIV